MSVPNLTPLSGVPAITSGPRMVYAWLTLIGLVAFAVVAGMVVLVLSHRIPSYSLGLADAVNLTYLFTGLLVPILPAFIVFKFLPSEANVSGPFQGLRIKLAGAFGGYFILALLVLYSPRPHSEEVWTVKGMIKNDTSSLPKPEEFIVNLEPPLVRVQTDGTFETQVPVTWQSGQRIFPSITILRQPLDHFSSATIHLGGEFAKLGKQYVIHFDEAGHEVDIDETIEITRLTKPYSPPDTQPTPVQQ
jgi:hypothetical protein